MLTVVSILISLLKITYCNVSNGIYDGSSEEIWYMEDGEIHDWDLEYVDGIVINASDDGIAAYCKNCGASLSAGTTPVKIPGLK